MPSVCLNVLYYDYCCYGSIFVTPILHLIVCRTEMNQSHRYVSTDGVGHLFKLIIAPQVRTIVHRVHHNADIVFV